MKLNRLNQRGFTMIEVVVVSGLIVVVVFSLTTALRMSQQFLSQVRGKRNRDRVVSSTLKNVVENIALFQKNFNTSDDWAQTLLDPKALPIPWDDNSVYNSLQECPNCPGRMGFVIQPISGMPGMNRLKIRITHSTLIQGYLDYVYILSDD